mmetsp:Transcript_10455/g.29076  ORF Transcript_10455/g.29076 Transcript_10455/m.29076 type:complete len:284 (-) Transcript_10455:150-1001(-)
MGRKSKGVGAPQAADAGAATAPAAEAPAPGLAQPPVLPNAALGMLTDPSMARVFAHNPLLAGQLAQQALTQAIQQAAVKPPGSGFLPEVDELAEHFGLDERITKRLDDEMRKRTESLDGDIAALWDVLEAARNPAGLLAVKIQEMQDGIFVGKAKLDKDLAELVKKFKLDDTAAMKLAGVLMARKDRRKEDLEQLDRRLETSNKPSAMVMMLLPKLRSGEPVGEPDRAPAPGSYADLREQRGRRAREGERRGRSRSRSRGRQKDRSRSRRRGGSRERRKRSRS